MARIKVSRANKPSIYWAAVLKHTAADPVIPGPPKLGDEPVWSPISDWAKDGTLSGVAATNPSVLDGSQMWVYQNGAVTSNALSATQVLAPGTYRCRWGVKIAGTSGHAFTGAVVHGASNAFVVFVCTAGSYAISTHSGWTQTPTFVDQGNGIAICTALVAIGTGLISRGVFQYTANSRSTVTSIHRVQVA